MIFKDILDEKEGVIRPAFQKLVSDCLENQAHSGDMLIWLSNGFYEKSMEGFTTSMGEKVNPHVVGPGDIGNSEWTHYSFINQYRQAYVSNYTFPEYLKLLEYSEESKKEIDGLNEFEETTINLELLVYLKFWESDSIIKRFYELIRIFHSENYNWNFKIKESNRDDEGLASRQDIIRKLVRDRIKDSSPEIYNALKSAYKTQIRNAIAHSKYAFQSRNIHLHNFIDSDLHAQIRSLPFDEWIDIFHTTLMLHNEYINATQIVQEHYRQKAVEHNNECPILITEKEGKQYEAILVYRPKWDDWNYKQ